MYIGLLEDNIFLKTFTQIQTCFNISLLCKVKIYRFLKIMNCSVINILNYEKLYCNCTFKLMKGKALRKHSLHEKTAASVLLKLFISGNE